jgi:hypothetical protein
MGCPDHVFRDVSNSRARDGQARIEEYVKQKRGFEFFVAGARAGAFPGAGRCARLGISGLYAPAGLWRAGRSLEGAMAILDLGAGAGALTRLATPPLREMLRPTRPVKVAKSL